MKIFETKIIEDDRSREGFRKITGEAGALTYTLEVGPYENDDMPGDNLLATFNSNLNDASRSFDQTLPTRDAKGTTLIDLPPKELVERVVQLAWEVMLVSATDIELYGFHANILGPFIHTSH